MKNLLSLRSIELTKIADPLPGSIPYDNHRPLNIPGRFDGQMLFDTVIELFPHISRQQWEAWFDSGHILQNGAPVQPGRVVRGGECFQHVFPDTVEPPVSTEIRWVWEDDCVVALAKPSPLPVHPCGRFNRNTLGFFLDQIYGLGALRLVHRLDANTSGLMILAKTTQYATDLRKQFEASIVEKRYLARVMGHPLTESFHCDEPIGRHRFGAGGRTVEESGLPALTNFRVLERYGDGTSLVTAEPKTGRTNQIRIHLWQLGFPIIGDPTYLSEGRTQAKQTLSPDEPVMCLHAASLRFQHPQTLTEMKLCAESPPWAR